MCDFLVYLNLYGRTICSYYEFASERKFIRHCTNQNQPRNLRLKAEIKSTPLILQTAQNSRKGNPQRNVTLTEIDTLLSLKNLIFGNTNYLRHRKLICCFNCILVISIKSSLLILQTAKESRKAFTYRLCDLLVYLNLYVSRICSHYEFARGRKFIRYSLNQNPPLSLLLKAPIKSTPLNLQTAKESSKGTRVHFASTGG